MASNRRLVFVAIIVLAVLVLIGIGLLREKSAPAPARVASPAQQLDDHADETSVAQIDEEVASGGFIAGVVMDSDGNPLEDVALRTVGKGKRCYTLSDANGMFRLEGLTVDAEILLAEKSGYSQGTLRNIPMNTAGVEVRLDDDCAIEGTVVDAESGLPVTDFEIVCQPFFHTPDVDSMWRNAQRVTAVDGAFRLEGLELGDATIYVRAPAYREQLVDVQALHAGETRRGVVVKLEFGQTMSGKVVDSGGMGIPDASIYLDVNALSTDAATLLEATRTGPDGSFKLLGLSELPILITASKRGSAYAPAGVRVEPSEEMDQFVEIVLRAGGTIHGIVQGIQTVAGLKLSVTADSIAPGDPMHHLESVIPGEFKITPVAVGDYTVIARANYQPGGPVEYWSISQRARVEEGKETSVTLDFGTRKIGIVGKVTRDGAPVARCFVSVGTEDTSGASDYRIVRTDESGEFRAEVMPADTARMYFNAKGAGESMQTLNRIVQLPSQGSVRVDVAMESGILVEGQVEGLNPSDTAMAVLVEGHVAMSDTLSSEFFDSYLPGQGASVDSTTGMFTFNGVDVGEYTLIIASYPTNDNNPEPALAESRFVYKHITVEADTTVDLELPPR